MVPVNEHALKNSQNGLIQNLCLPEMRTFNGTVTGSGLRHGISGVKRYLGPETLEVFEQCNAHWIVCALLAGREALLSRVRRILLHLRAQDNRNETCMQQQLSKSRCGANLQRAEVCHERHRNFATGMTHATVIVRRHDGDPLDQPR